ncbi:Clavaminate synthase-like protein [Dothidotthia symphoricarpi CBS 119687]|uniref:Clavaminate synthase-like protein n=1 Tax=Dothidotthia symphoricarpi CBS 119687 TaxID=1392245 RepID=A0A6A6ANP3_9PLEO|nr:Clavaminate synthase-like protein [Dothidotthia symphoricarpi CBS 119687]KAF2132517.1 Clavaminate synthase-like protein [Dothidotthia symphoricarpi CBS 119687]
MSLNANINNITARLPLRTASSCAVRPRSHTHAHAHASRTQRRAFFLKSFWSRAPRAAEHAEWNWNPAISGPFRQTKQQLKEQEEQEQKQRAEQESLAEAAEQVGALDGEPAQHVALEIDGRLRTFDTAFLRDSCACPLCRDPHSKQKLFQTSDIPEHLEGSGRAVVDEEKGPMVEFTWKNDIEGYGPEHHTRHSIDWLRRALTMEVDLRGGVRHDERVLWNRDRITRDNKWVDYKSYMTQDDVLFDALSHLNNYGLLFVKNVPDSETSVVDLASRIGTLKDTFYGRTWDVRSKPQAENIAYTPHFLGLHMDLLYTSNPPHLQLLHSLRARTPGGASFFSDSFHAAHQLLRHSASHFRALATFPVTYHYHHKTHHYHFTRPVLELSPYPKYADPGSPAIKRVNWSPPFQAPFESRIGSNSSTALRSFIAASHAYEKVLAAPENLFEYRLEEGECVLFDNRRVLHARRAFDASKGERWLKGAYVDDDVFFSRLRVLEEGVRGQWVAEGTVRCAVP